MSAITTHVLDTALGRPAAGVHVELEFHEQAGWRTLARGTTDSDGRLRTLLPDGVPLVPGEYRLVFDMDEYFARTHPERFYKRVTVEFTVGAGEAQCHVPLLLSPFGYSTYRGS
ncbi:MAG TPA: hydroxyisourate hydrolase [Vicinamibacterales bacterium]|jgi:5-hydroxyisourate hydrolase|nr:hydroxyisourate hydrolase [Vicinamibacterales bacterium]